MWQELEIAPTDDEKEIRRAYARRLRAIGGDRDPVAFQRLRRAYEAALVGARVRGERGGRQDNRSARPSPERPLGGETEAAGAAFDEAAIRKAVRDGMRRARVDGDTAAGDDSWEAEARSVRENIHRALAIGETEAAFKHLRHGLAKGLISLKEQPDAILEVMSAAVDDRRLKGPVFRFMAEQLGWNRPFRDDDSVHADLRERVIVRYGAEIWFEDLIAALTTAQPRSMANYHKRWLARFLLGGGRGWSIYFLFTNYLKEQLETYDQFASCLQHRVYLGPVEKLRSWLPHGSQMWIVLARGDAHHILLETPAFFYETFSRRRDRWGFNPDAVSCPFCGEPASSPRIPRNLRQALWGGWTCRKCRNEFDKFGKAIHR